MMSDISNENVDQERGKTLKEKMDQRVMLTQNLLKNALVQLMQEQHISKISVRALCDVAGINRSTFYMHFSDPLDLLHKIEQEVLQNLQRYLGKNDVISDQANSVRILAKIIRYIKENTELFKALLNENCDYTFQEGIIKLAEIVSMQTPFVADGEMQKYVMTFGINGCLSIIQEWLQNGAIESPEQMSEFIVQILYSGIISFNGDK